MLALAAFAVGCASALVPQLMDPTMPALNWRIVIGTGITAVLAAGGGSFLPRSGSTGIAAQVNELRGQGVHRDDMVVLSKDEAIQAVAAAPLTPEQVAQMVAAVKAEMAHDPEGDDPPAVSVPDHIIGLIDRDEGRQQIPSPPPVPDFDWNKG